MTINKLGLENETKGKMKETKSKFRGDLGKATGSDRSGATHATHIR